MKLSPVSLGLSLSAIALTSSAVSIPRSLPRDSENAGRFTLRTFTKSNSIIPEDRPPRRGYNFVAPIPTSGAGSDWIVNTLSVTDDVMKAQRWVFDNGTITSSSVLDSDPVYQLGVFGQNQVPVADSKNQTSTKFSIDLESGIVEVEGGPQGPLPAFQVCYGATPGDGELFSTLDRSDNATISDNCRYAIVKAAFIKSSWFKDGGDPKNEPAASTTTMAELAATPTGAY